MFESQDMVLFLPDKSCHSDAKILEVKHPKNGQPCMIYLELESKCIYELYKVKESHVSWFVGNHVAGDTKLTLSTLIDPLFLILPYLISSCDHFCPLDQILVDDKFPSIMDLESLISDEQLKRIAEVKPQDRICRYDKSRAIDWLSKKVLRVVDQLKDSKVSPGVNSSLTEEEYKQYACGIVSDYINPSLSADLHDKFGLKVIDYEEEKPAKKAKLNTGSETSPCLPEKPVKKNPPKGKERAPKAIKTPNTDTKGMKSMSSFFKKIEK